jgi:hypothetical protein
MGTYDSIASILAQHPGASISHVNKFGANRSIDTATVPEDVWTRGGLWVAPTAARVHDLASTSANDAAAGTGMRTLQVQGISGGVVAEEDVTLNGTSNVATVASYSRIFRLKGLTWGSGEVNAGTISATAQTDGTVTAEIETGGVNQSEMAIYSVPTGKTAYITGYYAHILKSGGASVVNVHLAVRDAAEANNGWRWIHEMSESSTVGGGEQHVFAPWIEVAEQHDIRLYVHSVTANNTGIVGGFDLVLVGGTTGTSSPLSRPSRA